MHNNSHKSFKIIDIFYFLRVRETENYARSVPYMLEENL